MKIKTITVGNYKNIGPTTLELGQIVALVSINNYGKSNLLEAIDFGFDYISGSHLPRGWLSNPVRVALKSREGGSHSAEFTSD